MKVLSKKEKWDRENPLPKPKRKISRKTALLLTEEGSSRNQSATKRIWFNCRLFKRWAQTGKNRSSRPQKNVSQRVMKRNWRFLRRNAWKGQNLRKLNPLILKEKLHNWRGPKLEKDTELNTQMEVSTLENSRMSYTMEEGFWPLRPMGSTKENGSMEKAKAKEKQSTLITTDTKDSTLTTRSMAGGLSITRMEKSMKGTSRMTSSKD